jgi:hypothetical protein
MTLIRIILGVTILAVVGWVVFKDWMENSWGDDD